MQIEKNNDLEKLKCPVSDKCGGCQLQHFSYEKQLLEKQEQVNALLEKFCKVEDIIGMESPYYYRNKVHAAFDTDKNGNVISGVYEAGSHRVVPIDSCLIEDQRADNIIVTIRGMLKSFKIRTYDEDKGIGLLRHVLIRTGHLSGEIMVVLVLASHIFPSKNNFIKALLKKHPEITTIVMNVNSKKTSMVLGEREQVLYGKGFIEDTLCGKVFRISPKSFYQINAVQTEVLYGKAIELADLKGKETIIDAYCGIGTIGIIASNHVNKVIGVELNRDAVKDAITNAKRNKVNNIYFYNQDAGEFMNQMAAKKQSVDVVFLDPPRSGSTEEFMNSMILLNPKKVVYISCNPATLERDLTYLVKRGYEVKKAIPVDMFPGTEHVETCVLLSHKNPQTSPPSL
ncbi:23S rRNA (uracil-C(5))-methyltransferase RlmCD [anaerobic digester metagenome]